MSLDQNKAVVTELLKALEIGDADTALGHLTADANWWVAGDLPVSGDHDRAAIEKLVTAVTSLFEGPVRLTPVSIVADGDIVSVETDVEADLKNGKHYANKYVFVFEFDGALVARVREYIDTKKVHDLMFS